MAAMKIISLIFIILILILFCVCLAINFYRQIQKIKKYRTMVKEMPKEISKKDRYTFAQFVHNFPQIQEAYAKSQLNSDDKTEVTATKEQSKTEVATKANNDIEEVQL